MLQYTYVVSIYLSNLVFVLSDGTKSESDGGLYYKKPYYLIVTILSF